MDYVIGEFIYMLPSDMNLRIGKIRRYNNKILIASPSFMFMIGNNVKINLDEGKDKQDVKSKGEVVVKAMPNIESNKEQKQDVKMMKTEPNTYQEEKVALILGTTAVFTLLWLLK